MDKLTKNYIIYFLGAVKIILSLFITYLIIFKGDAGSLIYNVGNFIVSGNSILGLFFLLSIAAIYPLILFNLTIKNNCLHRLKNFLMAFDFILVFVNLLFGIFIFSYFFNQQFFDALSKFIILASGSAIVYFIISIILLLSIRHFIYKNNKVKIENWEVNNMPLNFKGRIERIPYFITKVIFSIFIIIILGLSKKYFSDGAFDIYEIASLQLIFVLSVYAASKRLRDINWSQWLLLIWAIPFIGLCIGVPLLFIKGKTNK